MYNPHALKIYTDGSALRNPGGPGGIAGIAEYPDTLNREIEVIFTTGYRSTTNNRMELRACIEALNYVALARRALAIGRAIILTDSQYVSDNSRRAPYWRDGGRTNEAGRPIENSDLWRQFLRAQAKARIRVDITWIRGKSTRITRDADRAAKHAAKNPTEVDVGYVGGTVARRKTPGKTAATLFPAAGQAEVVRIYRLQPRKTSRGWVYKVFFDLFSHSTRTYVAVHYAYLAAAQEIHRNRCYEAIFDRDRRYPHIEALRECPCPEAEIDASP